MTFDTLLVSPPVDLSCSLQSLSGPTCILWRVDTNTAPVTIVIYGWLNMLFLMLRVPEEKWICKLFLVNRNNFFFSPKSTLLAIIRYKIFIWIFINLLYTLCIIYSIHYIFFCRSSLLNLCFVYSTFCSYQCLIPPLLHHRPRVVPWHKLLSFFIVLVFFCFVLFCSGTSYC